MNTSPAGDRRTTAPLSAHHVRQQVAQLQRRLVRLRAVRALLHALAVGAAAALLTRVAAWLAPDGAALLHRPATAWVIGAIAAIALLAWQWRGWTPITPVRAALWFEERHPAQHAVVTLVDTPEAELPADIGERLAAQAAAPLQTSRVAAQAVREAAWRAWRAPLATTTVALLCVVALSLTPRSGLARRLAGEVGGSSTSGAAATDPGARLANWRVTVVPPAYAKLPTRVLDDSSSLRALPGTRIAVRGDGPADGLTATLRNRADTSAPPRAVTVRDGDDGWELAVTMPAVPTVVQLSDGAAARLLALVPQPDSLPVVTLLSPPGDSVYRDTTGNVQLSAEARDDFGLASIRFEVIRTGGSGEQYVAETRVLGGKPLQGARQGAQRITLDFAEFGIASGDVIHLRAVALDEHPASDRELGVSETRSLRFARADEYDSVAVEAAPPPAVDSSMLSQRMLLDLTEKLEARRPTIARTLLVSESRRLATEQARIRRAVSAIVFQRFSGEGESEHVHYEGDGHDHGLVALAGQLVPTFGQSAATGATGTATTPDGRPIGASGQVNNNASDESPIVAVNRPLLEAYNAMWDAGRALELADTRAAIPAMQRALDAIQRARAAERVYLRGRARAVVVDLARVRLAGRDTGQSSTRRAGPAMDAPTAALEQRLLRAAELLVVNSAAARDSLVVLRLDALTAAPALATALDGVLAALRAGIPSGGDASAGGGEARRDARDGSEAANALTEALVGARRALSPPPAPTPLSGWSTP